MADEQARRGAAANQEDVRHYCDSAKATITRVTRGWKISHEGIGRVFGAKGEKLDSIEESKLQRKEQMAMGRLRSVLDPDRMYWLHKVGLEVGVIYKKCEVGKETAEHVVYDCPRIRHPPHEPTPPDTLANDPQKVV